MTPKVDITFDCLPLRSLGRIDIPMDASPMFQERFQRIKDALGKHGSLNTYYLYNANCTFHLTNNPGLGMLNFSFEGTILTDQADRCAKQADLQCSLVRETCDWLIEPVVHWWHETVQIAVLAEFDLYIAAGDLEKTVERMEKIEEESDSAGGYLGMYL